MYILMENAVKDFENKSLECQIFYTEPRSVINR